jgi:hypothetical protein
MKFRFYSSLKQPQNKGAALVLVLAFVVLLSGLVVAYLSRTSTDRRLAKSSFEDTSADLLARSALDIVVGDFKQEIVDGSMSASPPYTPTSNANVVPMRSGNPGTVPNLIRRSVRSDGLVAPAVPSRASAVNSSTDVSVNGRSVSLDRWNTHYLIPKSDTSNDDPAPVTSFIAPDWVIVSRVGPSVQTGIGTGSSALNNAANGNSNYVIGRYAYAVYDEGGLLDINVAGFPSPTPAPATYVGRKGVIAFADLTALPTTGSSFVSNTVINRIIGWRNYATVQPTGTFPSFTFTAAATSNFVNYFLDTSRDFRTVATNLSSNRTDQGFITRAELIKLRSDTGAGAATMLQYLGTFSRESNHSTWGNSGTELAGRFPLSRFDLFAITPPTNAAAIQQYFGLNYVPASGPTAEHWRYCGTSGNALLSAIPSVSGNSQSPDLFPLLKYALPIGTSISEILSIGASLIDQRDQNDDTTWIEFGDPAAPQKAFGVDKNASSEPGAPPPPSTVLVLNRDFRNVGELGYAYKNGSTSLDFRTAGSSDAPLLDLFTYNTATPRSGIVNLNTQNIYVLAAILMGAITTESSSATVPRTAATPAATNIINATTSLPAIGRQDVARLASAVTHSTFTPNEETKETTARALAEVGQTRTWGLMIDVIAQTGRYPPNAASLANFVVEGEKRYWLHVAIDRFTGQIIDQQLEPVYE